MHADAKEEKDHAQSPCLHLPELPSAEETLFCVSAILGGREREREVCTFLEFLCASLLAAGVARPCRRISAPLVRCQSGENWGLCGGGGDKLP